MELEHARCHAVQFHVRHNPYQLKIAIHIAIHGQYQTGQTAVPNVAQVPKQEVSHAKIGHVMRMISQQNLKNVINHVLGLFLHGLNVQIQNHVGKA